MKFYNVNQETIVVNGRSYGLKHSYPAPYERNELYLSLLKEQIPGTAQNFLEPDLGQKLHADIDFEYNYYVEDYQSFSRHLHNNLDQWMPSLNTWLLSENQLIDSETTVIMFSSYDETGKEILPERSLSKDYFRLRRHTTEEYGRQGVVEEYTKILFKTLPGYDKVEFINKEIATLYRDKENKREMFPMFAKFRLSGVEKNEFCNLIEEYELDSEFIDFLVSKRRQSLSSDDVSFRYRIEDEEKEISSRIALYRYEDFESHIESEDDKVISEPTKDQTPCEFFESFIKAQVFKSKVKEMIENMPMNQPSPVAFRLVKRVDNGFEGVVSRHYFFNYTDLETFLYFDSQVAYRERYRYSIRVVNMMKTTVVTTNNFSGEATGLVYIEEPYYKEDIYVLDSPPIAPDVNLVTYRGIDNKVLIMFNQMVDKKAEVPVYINPSDYDHFKEQYESQKIEEGEALIFESDDPADFEFFRLKEKPVEFKDFSNENYKVIQSNGAYSAAYEDTIVPNQTYYYMFRTQDRNGFVSNPSPIYEFVLIKQGETLYPKIRIVDLAMPEPPAQKQKSFKKYIKIGLSPSQYLLPKNESQDLDSKVGSHIEVGVSDDNILVSKGSPEKEFRKFKFRIRSKNTGKLIDINVTFKKNKVIKA